MYLDYLDYILINRSFVLVEGGAPSHTALTLTGLVVLHIAIINLNKAQCVPLVNLIYVRLNLSLNHILMQLTHWNRVSNLYA